MVPVILTAAGSDPSGGAGIQADLLTITAAGGYGASALTAITVQDSGGLRRIQPVDPELIRQQMDSIFLDMPVGSVKTGMLACRDGVTAVADVLRRRMPQAVVVDPVLAASRGGDPMDDAGVEALRSELLPLATLLTPNGPEAERLTGLTVRTVHEAGAAGKLLLQAGAGAVLVKGGHLEGAPGTDVLVTADRIHVLPGQWQDQPNDHGTGCVLSSAIATCLARGADLLTAVEQGRSFLAGALAHGKAMGKGTGAVDPMFRFRRSAGGGTECPAPAQ